MCSPSHCHYNIQGYYSRKLGFQVAYICPGSSGKKLMCLGNFLKSRWAGIVKVTQGRERKNQNGRNTVNRYVNE